MAALERPGVHAGGEPAPGSPLPGRPRGATARAWSSAREEQGEASSTAACWAWTARDGPAQARTLQMKEPIERADAASSLPSPSRSSASCCRTSRNGRAARAPARVEDRLALEDVLLADALLDLGHQQERAPVGRRLLDEQEAAGRREDRDGERRDQREPSQQVAIPGGPAPVGPPGISRGVGARRPRLRARPEASQWPTAESPLHRLSHAEVECSRTRRAPCGVEASLVPEKSAL